MATSSVPRAIAAVVTILRAAPSLADIEVIDGPPVDDQSMADQVFIGWAPDGEAAEFLQSFASAGARTRDENLTITGWLESWTGDDDIAARRERAFELLAAVENALRATDPTPTAPTLGGAVQWSEVTRGVLRQSYTEQGAHVGIAFTVSCRARI